MLRKKYELFIIAVLFFLMVFQLIYFHSPQSIKSVHVTYNKVDYSVRRFLDRINKNQLIFPFNYPVDSKYLYTHVSKSLDLSRYHYPKVLKAEVSSNSLSRAITHFKYNSHQIILYDDSKPINLDVKRCNEIEFNMNIGIGPAISLDASLVKVLMDFLEQYKSIPYYREIAPFFIDQLKLQLEHNVVDHYWYRLAGSSVWLEQYQAHFMISRILYSPDGQRNKPSISLTYGQLFDKNWKELTNTKIIVPSNDVPENPDNSSGNEEKKGNMSFKILLFPYFLPIPFYHDYNDHSGFYHGIEDPRMILVKNKNGYEEPLIIFNSCHRKYGYYDDDFDERILVRAKYYRSMFLCWPWQFQKGKSNVNGFSNKHYDNRLYNKVVELKLKNLERQITQKNWTPFIDIEVRKEYDEYLYFIYRWSNLEVLKCDLIYNTGVCSFSYRFDQKLSTSNKVGPFRGGTQLENINQLLGEKAKDFISEGRQVWLGFARAHIDSCGCGSSMYRPNLVVLIKDSLPGQLPKYKLTHISSSLSLDVPVVGFDLLQPQNLCNGPNVLIPNGISSWDITFENGILEDYTTLSLSISDYTVHRINLRGILQQLFLQFDFKQLIDDLKFNNDNIVCALQLAFEFCKAYGEDHIDRKADNFKISDLKKIFNMGQFVEADGLFNLQHFIDYLNEEPDVAEYKKAITNNVFVGNDFPNKVSPL